MPLPSQSDNSVYRKIGFNLSFYDGDTSDLFPVKGFNNIFQKSIDQGTDFERQIFLYKFSENPDIITEDKYLIIEGNYGGNIDLAGINEKGWFTQLRSFKYPTDDVFSASLPMPSDDSDSRKIYWNSDLSSDEMAFAISLNQNSFLYGTNKIDGMSGCYDKVNCGIAFYGMFQKFINDEFNSNSELSKELSDKGKIIIMNYDRYFFGMLTDLKINKSEFQTLAEGYFDKGSFTCSHLNPYTESLETSVFYNSIEKMKDDKVGGEVLIKDLNLNESPIILVLPSKYSEGNQIDDQTKNKFLALKKCFENNLGREILLGLFDNKKISTEIVEIGSDNLIKKITPSVNLIRNPRISSSSQCQSSSAPGEAK